MKKFAILLTMILLVVFIAGCSSKDDNTEVGNTDDKNPVKQSTPEVTSDNSDKSFASFDSNQDDNKKGEDELTDLPEVKPEFISPEIENIVVRCEDSDISVERAEFVDNRKQEKSFDWSINFKIKNNGDTPVYLDMVEYMLDANPSSLEKGQYVDIQFSNLYVNSGESVWINNTKAGIDLQGAFDYVFNADNLSLTPYYIISHKTPIVKISDEFNTLKKAYEDSYDGKGYGNPTISFSNQINGSPSIEDITKIPYVDVHDVTYATVNAEKGWHSMFMNITTVAPSTDVKMSFEERGGSPFTTKSTNQYISFEEVIPAGEKMIEIPLEDADPSKLGRIIITALAVDSA
jgi:hypothetical protein